MNDERLEELVTATNTLTGGTPVAEGPRVEEARVGYANTGYTPGYTPWGGQTYDWNEITHNRTPNTLTGIANNRRDDNNLDYVFALIDRLEKRIDRLERDLMDTENELVKKIRELQQATGFKYIKGDDYDG